MSASRVSWLPVGDSEAVMLKEFGGGSPVVSLIAGVHGDEREGVVALGMLSRELRSQDVAGTIRLVPVANPPAYHAQSRTSPRDRLNLARVFPGNAQGSVSERIAASITESVISGSDLLVDLHSAGLEWVMPFFTGYVSVTPDIDEVAFGACSRFGAGLVWRHDVGAEGRSLSAARALGVPAIYVETGGGNRILEADLNAYLEGCLRVLEFMGSIEREVVEPSGLRVVPGGHGNLDAALAAPATGHLVALRQAGDIVAAGDVLFDIIQETGANVVEVSAPHDGIVMAIRRATSIQEGADLAIIGPSPASDVDRTRSERAGVEAPLDFHFNHLGKMMALVTNYDELSDVAIKAVLGEQAASYRATAESSRSAVETVVRQLMQTKLSGDLQHVDIHDGERILFIGDSITADWRSWREIFMGLLKHCRPDLSIAAIDQSVSGATTVDLLRRAQFIVSASPTLAFAMIGTNDSLTIGARARKPLVGKEEFRVNLIELARHISEAGARRTVWLTPPPVDSEALLRGQQGVHVAATADEVRLDEYADVVIELFGPEVIDTRDAASDWQSLLPDGIHPSIQGHAAIARHVVAALRQQPSETPT